MSRAARLAARDRALARFRAQPAKPNPAVLLDVVQLAGLYAQRNDTPTQLAE